MSKKFRVDIDEFRNILRESSVLIVPRECHKKSGGIFWRGRRAMDKNIYNTVADRSQGKCEHCGAEFDPYYSKLVPALHHVFRRKKGVPELPETCVMLCWNCHQGTDGVHGKNGRKTDIHLKIMCQNMLRDSGCSESDIREVTGGRIYTGDMLETKT